MPQAQMPESADRAPTDPAYRWTRRAVYPGSFDPPTIAHLAIAMATLEQCLCTSITFALSYDALGKPERNATVNDRHAALSAIVNDPRCNVIVTTARLIADIASGFDVVVMGADKWSQVLEPRWYDDGKRGRDRALAALPHVAVVPRPPHTVKRPSGSLVRALTILELSDPTMAHVSSSAVRAGRAEWLARPARLDDDEDEPSVVTDP